VKNETNIMIDKLYPAAFYQNVRRNPTGGGQSMLRYSELATATNILWKLIEANGHDLAVM
jgi:hypothetical protein